MGLASDQQPKLGEEELSRHIGAMAMQTDALLDAIFTNYKTSHASGRLVDAMAYATLNGGKRIRAYLVYGGAGLINRQSDEASQQGIARVAAAFECLHAYSLIHDDLPAMDDAATRRGKPSCHLAFDEATAILAGDALQTLALPCWLILILIRMTGYARIWCLNLLVRQDALEWLAARC